MILGLSKSVQQYLQTYAADRMHPIRGIKYMQIKQWYMLRIGVHPIYSILCISWATDRM